MHTSSFTQRPRFVWLKGLLILSALTFFVSYPVESSLREDLEKTLSRAGRLRSQNRAFQEYQNLMHDLGGRGSRRVAAAITENDEELRALEAMPGVIGARVRFVAVLVFLVTAFVLWIKLRDEEEEFVPPQPTTPPGLARGAPHGPAATRTEAPTSPADEGSG